LEATSTHGADKLLEKVRSRLQEQAEAQQDAAALQQMQQVQQPIQPMQ
jgi:hypothetical protein